MPGGQTYLDTTQIDSSVNGLKISEIEISKISFVATGLTNPFDSKKTEG